MATYQSFIGDLNAFAKELGGDKMAVAVGVEAKKLAEAVASSDLGGDPKFSNWKPVLATRFDVVGPQKISFKPTKRSAGPWTVAEKGRNGKRNGKTRGKGTATKAVADIEAAVPKIVSKELAKIVKSSFGG